MFKTLLYLGLEWSTLVVLPDGVVCARDVENTRNGSSVCRSLGGGVQFAAVLSDESRPHD